MYDLPLYRGESVMKMIDQKPLFDTSIFYKVDNKTPIEDGIFCRACMAVNVDPDIVKKQAELIVKLQKALDCKMNDSLGLYAPSFKQYFELAKENEELKSKLQKIQDLL